jgi:hypothetical protein
MKIDFDRDDIMEEAYEVYFKILSEAVQEGRTQDPLRLVGFFLGLNISENIIYQKLLDSGCTIEDIEKSKERIQEISQRIVAEVKGRVILPSGGEEM